MSKVFGYAMLFVGGAFLGGTGLDPSNLHWWAIVVPTVIGASLV